MTEKDNNRYDNGKIYKLVNDVNEEIYVGSTCMPLHKRLYEHKYRAKKKPEMKVYKCLNVVGWESVKIILVEDYPCKSKDELIRRERYWIETLKPSLNKNIPTRTKKEYRDDNRKELIEKHRAYNKAHKEEINAKKKVYREAHKEEIKAKNKTYYQAKKLEKLQDSKDEA